MTYRSKLSVMAGFVAFTMLGIAATHPPDPGKPEKRNLKVLPKDLPDAQLEAIMYKYEKQLGVGCVYCHVAEKKGAYPPRADFASDEKPEKLIAREMIRMTNKINKKYFNVKKADSTANTQPEISCKTCHRGFPRPVFPSYK